MMPVTATLAPSSVSAPPPPPIPRLEHPLAPDDLVAALREFGASYYIVHPFHQLMHAGQLNRRQLQGWVANRLAYQRVIPRKDAAILSNCPHAEIRRVWIQRIIDHDGTEPGTGGIELWIQLGEALGVPREEMEDERHILPTVRLICEEYVSFCKAKPWIEAVASSLTELFAPDIHRARIETFPTHYPWIRQESFAYFKSRLIQAPRDCRHGLALVRQYCTTADTQRGAFEALKFKVELLWAMIDTIHHAYLEA